MGEGRREGSELILGSFCAAEGYRDHHRREAGERGPGDDRGGEGAVVADAGDPVFHRGTLSLLLPTSSLISLGRSQDGFEVPEGEDALGSEEETF